MKEVNLRKATKNDWDFILLFRNNKKININFYTKNENEIKKQDHYDYLRKQEKNKNFLHWIISFNDLDVGYVRILKNDVSIMLDEKCQGNGIGTLALKELEKEAKSHGIKKLVGRIMIHNEQSRKIFEKNNYKLLMYWLEKDIS
jgi:RimJ/RimL family protein N-acetyltransferase